MPGKQVDIAWAAGVLDCDGHIGAHWQKANPKRREVNGRMRLVVTVSGTIPAIPERMHELFGGSLHRRPGARDHYKPVTIWTVTARKAEVVLRAVGPFLVGKADLAAYLLAEREEAA